MSDVVDALVMSPTTESATQRKPWSAPRVIISTLGRATDKNHSTISTPDQHFSSTFTTS
jgi:hypothetical protein